MERHDAVSFAIGRGRRRTVNTWQMNDCRFYAPLQLHRRAERSVRLCRLL